MIALMLALAFLAGNRQKSADEMRHTDQAQAAQLVADSRDARRTKAHAIGLQMQGRLYLPVRIRGEEAFGQRFRVFGVRIGIISVRRMERVTKLPV